MDLKTTTLIDTTTFVPDLKLYVGCNFRTLYATEWFGATTEKQHSTGTVPLCILLSLNAANGISAWNQKDFSKLITVAGYSSWKIDFAQESKNLTSQCHQSLGKHNWRLDVKLFLSPFLENL